MLIRSLYRRIRHLGTQLLLACGCNLYIRSKDREVLENSILPYLAGGSEWRKILFVGCAWYTRGYQRLFRRKQYSTIEIDPRQARFGAARHIVGSVENVRNHFDEGELDAIICNGVFGWGLNEQPAVERTFEGCHQCLRDGGVLVLGWNDLPEYTPFPLGDCRALKSFSSWIFPPLGVTRLVLGPGQHTYDFYIKDPAPVGTLETESTFVSVVPQEHKF